VQLAASRNLMQGSLLHRYWFKTKDDLGFGVTAYSTDDAKSLVTDAARLIGLSYEVVEIVEDVDVRELEQDHVVPNMGPPNFRGVWFPNLSVL
jgi:hypothetical protein